MKRLLSLLAVFVISTSTSLAVTDVEQKKYDEFMLKLKACTPTTSTLFDGTHQVLGYENGACGYKVTYNNKSSYTCKFPKPVAEMFGYQATKTLREGIKNTFAENMLNSGYCQKN